MALRHVVFWDVDTQVDFMLPHGKLYVPGAERIIPNLKRLVDVAREGRVLLVADVDAHVPDEEEFKDFPPHCVQGTPGQKKIPETLMPNPLIIPNAWHVRLPDQFAAGQQVIIEKRTLDVFTNPSTEAVLDRVVRSTAPEKPEFIVFGVATEYCVLCVVSGLLDRGHSVSIVTDAIEALNATAGQQTLGQLRSRGARLITAEQALALV